MTGRGARSLGRIAALTAGLVCLLGPAAVAQADPETVTGTSGADTIQITATSTDDATAAVNAATPITLTDVTSLSIAAGAGNDAITITNPGGTVFAPAGGIDVDGGGETGGPGDSLAVLGGAAADGGEYAASPVLGDGTISHVDGFIAQVIDFTDLEPLADTVTEPAYAITGTAGGDAISIGDGSVVGRLRVEAPTFESAEFANKTGVTVNADPSPADTGADTLLLSPSAAATGLSTLSVDSGDDGGGELFSVSKANLPGVTTTLTTGGEIAGGDDLDYSGAGLALDAGTGVGRDGGLDTAVANVEAESTTGGVAVYQASGPITVGGTSPTIDGLTAIDSGDAKLWNSGTITVSDAPGAQGVKSGDDDGEVNVIAFGPTSDVVFAGGTGDAVTSPAGDIEVIAGRDLVLNAGAQNDMSADGAIHLRAAGALDLGGSADVTSTLSGVNVQANRMLIGAGAGISTPANQAVSLAPVSAARPVDLGSATDAAAALELADPELDQVSTGDLVIRTGTGGQTVTAPIVPAGATALKLVGGGGFTGAGAGALTENRISLTDTSSSGRTFTQTQSTLNAGAGTPFGYTATSSVSLTGGGGADTLNVQGTPAGPTTLLAGGAGDDLVGVGSAGDSLDPIAGSLTVAGGENGGTDELRIRDGGEADPHTYAIDSVGVARSGGTPTIGYAGIEALRVDGGSLADTFNVHASPSAAYTLNGNAPGVALGDSLNYDADGRPVSGNTTASSGTISSPGVEDVVYTGMESVTPVIQPGTGSGAGSADGAECQGHGVTIVAAPGERTVGTPGDDVIIGTPGPDVIDGGRGDDRICALARNDAVHGGGGDDVARGGSGDDELKGGNGVDQLTGQTGDDAINGGGGRDRCEAGRGDDALERCT